MRYLFTLAALVIGVGLAGHDVIAGGAGAQPDPGDGRGSPSGQSDPAGPGRCAGGVAGVVSDSTVSGRRLIGMRVTNPINEQIGEVSDVIIDQCGRMKSIVVHIGGFLGIGGRHVRLALDQVRIRSLERSAGMVVMVRRTRDHILSRGNTSPRGGNGD